MAGDESQPEPTDSAAEAQYHPGFTSAEQLKELGLQKPEPARDGSSLVKDELMAEAMAYAGDSEESKEALSRQVRAAEARAREEIAESRQAIAKSAPEEPIGRAARLMEKVGDKLTGRTRKLPPIPVDTAQEGKMGVDQLHGERKLYDFYGKSTVESPYTVVPGESGPHMPMTAEEHARERADHLEEWGRILHQNRENKEVPDGMTAVDVVREEEEISRLERHVKGVEHALRMVPENGNSIIQAFQFFEIIMKRYLYNEARRAEAAAELAKLRQRNEKTSGSVQGHDSLLGPDDYLRLAEQLLTKELDEIKPELKDRKERFKPIAELMHKDKPEESAAA